MLVTSGWAPSSMYLTVEQFYISGPFSPPLPRENFDTCSKVNKLEDTLLNSLALSSVGKLGSTGM